MRIPQIWGVSVRPHAHPPNLGTTAEFPKEAILCLYSYFKVKSIYFIGIIGGI